MKKSTKNVELTIPKIQKTTNYDQFSFVGSNRLIVTKHAHDLEEKKKIKDHSELFPIIVDKDHKILEGQHRFEANKALGLPIYYIVSNTFDVKDIAMINTSTNCND